MKILQLLATSLSVAVLAACCGLWLLVNLPVSGWKVLAVPTGSMRPGVPVGSLAVVRRVPISALKPGDVITYINPLNVHQTITHRIIKEYRIGGTVPGFITKGDANSVADVPIAGGSVQGKMIWHAPYLGTLFTWMKSWTGIAILVYLPALIIMVQECKRLSDYYRESLPYRLASYSAKEAKTDVSGLIKLAAAPLAGLTFAIGGAFAWQPLAAAQPITNTVVLAGNHLSRAMPAATCSVAHHNVVSITSNTTQTASSGSVSVNGSTNNESAVRGNVTNSSSTNISVTVDNQGCQIR